MHGQHGGLNEHVSYGFLFAGNDDDIDNLLEMAGLPFVTRLASQRGFKLAYVTGSLESWQTLVNRSPLFDGVAEQLRLHNLTKLPTRDMPRLT